MSNKINLEEDFDPEISDSDNELTARERKLLKKVRKPYKDESSDSEEVLPFSESEDEKPLDSDEDNQKAWGKKKSSFYNTNLVDNDYQLTEKQEEIVNFEQKEALELQKKLAKEINEADFSLDFFCVPEADKEEGKSVKIIKTDISDLSKKKKLSVFRNEAPEFEGLVSDFEKRLQDCMENLVPLSDLEGPLLKFVECRKNLIYNYCSNIAFYLLLKSKRISVKNHPVIKRLVQFRQLLNQLDQSYEEVFEKFLKINKEKSKLQEKQKKLLSILKTHNFDGPEEQEPMKEESIQGSSMPQKFAQDSDEDGYQDNEDANMETDGISKRKISYQMAKNKGLSVHKRKELRNPRVKNKMKFKKAVMRRRGKVRPIRDQTKLYDGEHTGIKAYLKRSVNLK